MVILPNELTVYAVRKGKKRVGEIYLFYFCHPIDVYCFSIKINEYYLIYYEGTKDETKMLGDFKSPKEAIEVANQWLEKYEEG